MRLQYFIVLHDNYTAASFSLFLLKETNQTHRIFHEGIFRYSKTIYMYLYSEYIINVAIFFFDPIDKVDFSFKKVKDQKRKTKQQQQGKHL